MLRCWRSNKTNPWVSDIFFSFLVISTPFYSMHMVLKFCLNIIYEIRVTKTSLPFNSVLVFSLIICILSMSLKFPSEKFLMLELVVNTHYWMKDCFSFMKLFSSAVVFCLVMDFPFHPYRNVILLKLKTARKKLGGRSRC